MANRSEAPVILNEEREAHGNNEALKKAFERAGGLNPDFFSTGGAGTLGTDLTDGYTREEIEALQRKLWGGRWGKPRPDAVNSEHIKRKRGR